MSRIDTSQYKLQVEESIRVDCPVCNGRNTLGIKRNVTGYIYNCFRASCNLSGMNPTNVTAGSYFNVKHKENKFELPDYIVYGYGRDTINSDVKDYLTIYNALETLNQYDIAYDPRQHRLLFLVKEDNKIIGAVGRSLFKSKLKVLNYNKTHYKPFIVGDKDHAIIVEDCASAASIARHDKYCGIALFGTKLNKNFIKYLDKYETLTVALDKDAGLNAIKMSQYLNTLFGNTKVLLLNKDLKDEKDITWIK